MQLGRVRLVREISPADVGRRVMLRRALPDGGYGDVLGRLVRWADGRLVIRTRTGAEVVVDERTVVAGRRVPPPPPRRVSADRLQEVAGLGWRPVEQAWLGRWWLRAAAGFTGRANSVLPLGDPGLPLDETLERVRRWYAERALLAQAMVVAGSPVDSALEERGWPAVAPGSPPAGPTDVLVQTAPLGPVLDALLDRGVPEDRVRLDDEPDDAWLGLYRVGRRAATLPAVARQVIGHPDARFARLERDGTLVAIGRVVVVDGWAGLSAVAVHPTHRRQGLARAVLAGLLRDAGGRGARDVHLQVAADNLAAVGLYAGLGFATHHAYRYRAAPGIA